MINKIRIFVDFAQVASLVLAFSLQGPSAKAMESSSASKPKSIVFFSETILASMDKLSDVDLMTYAVKIYAGYVSDEGRLPFAKLLFKIYLDRLENLEYTEREGDIARHFIRKIEREEKLTSFEDFDLVIQDLLVAAALGERQAQRALGQEFFRAKNHEDAFFWLELYASSIPACYHYRPIDGDNLANQDIDARRTLALMYREGLGVPKNSEKAGRLSQSAEYIQTVTSLAKYNAALRYLERPGAAHEDMAEKCLIAAASNDIPQAKILLNLIAAKRQGLESYVENILNDAEGSHTNAERRKMGIRLYDNYRSELNVIEDISKDFEELSKIVLTHLLAASKVGHKDAARELGKIKCLTKHPKFDETKSEILRHVLSDLEKSRKFEQSGHKANHQRRDPAEGKKPTQASKEAQHAFKHVEQTLTSSKSKKSKSVQRTVAAPKLVAEPTTTGIRPQPRASSASLIAVSETLPTNLQLPITPSIAPTTNIEAHDDSAIKEELEPKKLELEVVQEAAVQMMPKKTKRLVDTLLRRSSRGKMHPVSEDGSFINLEKSEEKSVKGKWHFRSSKKSLADLSACDESDSTLNHRTDFVSISRSERDERSCVSRSEMSEMQKSLAEGEFKSLVGALRARDVCCLSQVQLDQKTIRDTLLTLKQKGIIEVAEPNGKIRATLINDGLIKKYYEAFGNTEKSIPSLTIHLHNHDKSWNRQKRARQHFLDFLGHCGLDPNSIIWDAAHEGEEGDTAAEEC